MQKISLNNDCLSIANAIILHSIQLQRLNFRPQFIKQKLETGEWKKTEKKNKNKTKARKNNRRKTFNSEQILRKDE